jgi:Protein of unknown function (DUF3800)
MSAIVKAVSSGQDEPVASTGQGFGRLLQILKPDIVMMMEAYFDESGTHDGSPVVCVAGYLFDSEQAFHLDREWVEVLKEFGLSHFHAHHCAHRILEFKGMSDEHRTKLLMRLVGIIKRRMTIGIAVSMSETDFGKVAPPIWTKGGPYALCAFQVLSAVTAWAEKCSYHGKISYFFEAGHKHQNLTNDAIEQLASGPIGYDGLRYQSHAFAGKLDLRPLQAADLLAYEWYKELKRLKEPSTGRAMRRSLESLLNQRHIQAHYNSDDLDRFIAKDFTGLQEKFSRFLVVE